MIQAAFEGSSHISLGCVFVLAIDYDVVVKGLEGKFGKKTEENDREFRSFFDKIIQVPFSMPTGAYTIEDLMKDRLSVMGINIPE
ncbi:KAP family NTPase, partial [Akkermansiaceae bacterium]|nr:KAP family NTPase [Akkermansiaceae bacterium]